MYVISLHYTAPLEEIDRLVPAHLDWLHKAYAAGKLLASGRKVPRSGGIMLARQMPRSELDELLANDPFALAGVARYDITEFVAAMTASELASLQELPR